MFTKIMGPSLKEAILFHFVLQSIFKEKTISPPNKIFSLRESSFGDSLSMITPFFASNKSKKSYKDKTYLKKIMLAPERGEACENIQAIDFIYRLLLKYLSPNEIFR
jgi:hypothetical protein